MTHAPLPDEQSAPSDELDRFDRVIEVAVDIGPLHGHRTGVGVATDGMVEALRGRGDVRLDPYLISFRSTPVKGQRKLPLPGIVASHLWSRTDRPRADRWLRGCDVVHGTNYVAPPSDLPTVISVYDCWFLAHPELATPLVRRAGRSLRRAVERGAWVHTSSDATAEQARELLGTGRVVTVGLGPPPAPPPHDDLARPGAAGALDGRPFVLAIGTEERRKDITLLVDAFERVAADTEDPVLVLAGAPGNLSDDLTTRIERLPPAIRPRVLRLGSVDDTTKHWLLRHATVLAYPSLDEGFGFPILEAQAAGTPVVACSAGSIPEVAGDAALLLPDRNADEFAAALDRLLNDGTARLLLIEAGYRNLVRFSWDDTAAGLVDLYHRAIGDRT